MDAEQRQRQWQLELEELHARIVKMGTETAKINAETIKLQTENKWYPFVAGAAFFAAVLGIVKVFF